MKPGTHVIYKNQRCVVILSYGECLLVSPLGSEEQFNCTLAEVKEYKV